MDIFDLSLVDRNKIALIENDKQISYGKLIENAMGITEKIKKRSLVFIIAENTCKSIEIYIGTLLSGSVPLLLHEDISVDKLLKLVTLYRPAFIFAIKGSFNTLVNYRVISSWERYVLWENVLKGEVEYPINKELALLLSTSGSTGSPKCVKISYENLKVNTKAIIEYLNIMNTDKAITTLPMDYAYGLSIINTHLMAGATIVLSKETVISEKFWESIEKYSCTTFGGVPFTYEVMIKLNLFDRLRNIRYLTQAGGKLHKKQVRIMFDECQKREIKFIIMYGQTEATARMAYLPWNYCEQKLGSIGIPIPGGKFEIVDEVGNKVENGVEGELVYKGQNVSMGYSNSYEELMLENEFNGILYTGDIAFCDNDGFYYITGRKNRFLKFYGNRVNLDEIEERINNEGIECACVGKDNYFVAVIINSNYMEKVKEIINNYGIEKRNIKVYSIESLPYQTSGKINYMLLKEIYVE